jgi:hypothetical protein
MYASLPDLTCPSFYADMEKYLKIYAQELLIKTHEIFSMVLASVSNQCVFSRVAAQTYSPST